MEAGSDPIMLHIIDSSYDTYPIFICTTDLGKRKKNKGQKQGEDYGWECFGELSCLFGNSFLVPSQKFMACVKHWTFVLRKG